jgi:ABC-2 type transport system ATP-binding protein
MQKAIVRQVHDDADGAPLLRTETYIGDDGLRGGMQRQAQLLQALARQLRGRVQAVRDLSAQTERDVAWVNRLAIGAVEFDDAIATLAEGEGTWWVRTHGAARFDIPDLELYGLARAQLLAAETLLSHVQQQLLWGGLTVDLTAPDGTPLFLVPVLEAWQHVPLDWPGVGRAGKDRGPRPRRPAGVAVDQAPPPVQPLQAGPAGGRASAPGRVMAGPGGGAGRTSRSRSSAGPSGSRSARRAWRRRSAAWSPASTARSRPSADVSFTIAPGEVVGFLGPNGAGKTTTLKMLSGLLHPSTGHARVLGHEPAKRERAYLGRITLVMGNRNQLQWDLPVVDSFEMNRAIFGIPRPDFERSRDELVELLEIGDLVTKPVRNLSLGERMKAEIAGAMLHRPQVLFLDEPTIGLDVTMQKRIRAFLAEYNRRHGATVMLTSHYMADVQALCDRVIVIHHGRLLFDGPLAALSERFAATKTITVPWRIRRSTSAATARWWRGSAGKVTVRVPRGAASTVAARLLADHTVTDLTIEDPPIEDVIEAVFATPGDRPDGDPAR